ncbi:MAG TPA: beta-ketoacyl synthase N-terminal-like domain-containing protein, partial [Streptosporangiaceae bacterium]|nr:beta-ketoacyl synthase N-terminal-like domain-containing protein [Streptosporangiaceae bacterium]
MTGHLAAADQQRLARTGIVPMPASDALGLLDAALSSPCPAAVIPARLAVTGTAHPLLRGLAPHRFPARPPAAALSGRLAAADPGQQHAIILDLVRTHAAAILGHPGTGTITPERPFRELGFDSLTALELRNQLSAATSLRLPATILFDHPTPATLTTYLHHQLVGSTSTVAPSASPVAHVTVGSDDPVVVVGVGCRFPGGVGGPEELWELVASGTDAVGEFPGDRGWDAEGLYDPDPDAVGHAYCRHGGFLYEAGGFDAEFFGISPREAVAIDPQQRLLLETAWEALERAGIEPGSLRGSSTGVFTGVVFDDYGIRLVGRAPEGLEGYLGTGSAGSVASGRVAYTFGFEGPAVTVDTACSSSLVAVHLACQALRLRECDLALAGGVTVMATPFMFVEFSRQRGLAADGRCKPFAAAADGTGWGEGAGLVVLERLSDARARGHRVLAVIRGSAVNQDGTSNGLTAPSGPAQQRVIRQALANAGLGAADVDVVEAHGTGTALGDPIEAQALLATYGQGRPAGRPLLVGAVKSNIGHAQAAAGVAGMVKMITAMQQAVVPATLHVDAPTPHVDWAAGAVRVVTRACRWPERAGPRRAAVSSFGISGTNAHLILEQAAAADAPAAPAPAAGGAAAVPVPWLLSARSGAALADQARRLAGYLARWPDADPVSVAAGLAGRAVFAHRAAVLAADRQQAAAALAALAAGDPHPALVTGPAVPPARPGRTAFLFTGQGSQHPGMGAKLHTAYPAFAAALEECFEALDPYLARPLRDVMFAAPGTPGAALLDQTAYTQPALFAFHVASYRQLAAFGISPDFLIGHSIGEISAAHLSGMLSLPDTARLVATRA